MGERFLTGVEGLDGILAGGLPRECMYLVQGDPGSGKTTLALQFLLEGVRQGENGFYRDHHPQFGRYHPLGLAGVGDTLPSRSDEPAGGN